MKTKQLIHLILGAFAAIEQEQDESPLKVIPLVINDVAEHIGILREIFRVESGILIEASDPTVRRASTVDLELKTAMEALFSSSPLAATLSLNVQLDSQMRVQTLINGNAAPSSEAEKALAGISNSLQFLASTDYPTACLIYKEAALENQAQDLIWQFLVTHLVSIGLGNIKRLFIIVDGALNYTRHTYPINSARFVLFPGYLSERNSFKVNKITIDRLANLRKDLPIVLFLGAGFSVSSKLMEGNDLRDIALQALIDPRKTMSPEERPGAFLRELIALRENREEDGETIGNLQNFARTLTLERVLSEEYRRGEGPIRSPTLRKFEEYNRKALQSRGMAVRNLQAIASHIIGSPDQKLIVAGVNFDTLVEHLSSDEFEVFATDQEFSHFPEYLSQYWEQPNAKIPYLKFHGSIDNFESVIATLSSTEVGLSREKSNAIEAILNLSEKIQWVFVGCSMRDVDLNRMYNSPNSVKKSLNTGFRHLSMIM
ncbi:SIR2 family protein [Deinococcus radiopugnans]|uniref:SIR2 family protein n=1 Tax=Deinococcus radiopugnans TaxID=57497 RepID=UPI00361B15DC